MSDVISDAQREANLIDDVEWAATDLMDALLATGDPMFCKINPAGIRYANSILNAVGLRLEKINED